MKGKDIFPSDWMKADDIGQGQILTIQSVILETVGDDNKPVCRFVENDKGLVLNKTNWMTLVDITGQEDSDYWPGHRVYLYRQMVNFQGRMTPGIRIQRPLDQQAPQQSAAPVQPPPPPSQQPQTPPPPPQPMQPQAPPPPPMTPAEQQGA